MTSRYSNGIPLRTIGGEDDTQQDDFEEEQEGLRGVYTAMNDGFTFRLGSDIISHMDSRGAFHPRRYVVQMNVGLTLDTEGTTYQEVDIIVCEDGPRITLTFPWFTVTQPEEGNFGKIQNLDEKLPKIICPCERLGSTTANVMIPATASGGLVTYRMNLFTLTSGGDFSLVVPGTVIPSVSFDVPTFSITYDTGKY